MTRWLRDTVGHEQHAEVGAAAGGLRGRGRARGQRAPGSERVTAALLTVGQAGGGVKTGVVCLQGSRASPSPGLGGFARLSFACRAFVKSHLTCLRLCS